MTINGTTAPGYASAAPVVEINANGQAGLDVRGGLGRLAAAGPRGGRRRR